MSKIYITGDTHGSTDLKKLNTKRFPEQRNLTKSDYLIIAGDYGQVWDNSKEDLYNRRQLNERNFTTLFIDGNHENFDILNKYPVDKWKGGKVHFIESSIIHLMRGQVYNIDGVKIFTMGGARSIDKIYRTEGLNWWPEEEPSFEEYDEAIDNLNKHNWEVDYVISHIGPDKVLEAIGFRPENNQLAKFFGVISKKLKYKKWFFGHMHVDKEYKKYRALFNDIVLVNE